MRKRQNIVYVTRGAGCRKGSKVLWLGGRSWCSLSSRLHILGLAAPGSSSGCPRAARRVLGDAPGSLRGLLFGVLKGP